MNIITPLSRDIQDISKLLGERLEHSKKIECSFGTLTLYPITDLTIAIYSHGEYVKNVGEVDYTGKKFEPISEEVNMCFDPLETEKVIFKGIAILLKDGTVLILNKQDYTVQQVISLDEFLKTLNCAYSAMDKSSKLDPCTSKAYYVKMLGYRITDASDKYPEILEGLEVSMSLEKELEEKRRQTLNDIEELEKWLNKFDEKVDSCKTITSQELNKRDSKKAKLESLKNSLKNINFRLT